MLLQRPLSRRQVVVVAFSVPLRQLRVNPQRQTYSVVVAQLLRQQLEEVVFSVHLRPPLLEGKQRKTLAVVSLGS